MRVVTQPVLIVTMLAMAAPALAQPVQSFRQTQTDDYTRYELLDPSTHSFRIYYDVSATTPGARHYFNGLRAGSEHTVTAVSDLATGQPLQWQVVSGTEALATGMSNANPNGEYLQVTLARPVPEGGQQRIRIDKTYRDTASYYTHGAEIVFDRSLGIDRNAVVLPAGYEVVEVSYPSQVEQESDGRIRVSFMNAGPAAVPYRVAARKLPPGPANVARIATRADVAAVATVASLPSASAPASQGARVDYEFTERAFEDRDITYFLMQPETHSFRLYHDYTEKRAGVDRYLNIVRAGSKVTDPEAINLDAGESLRVETLRGAEITRRGIDVDNVTPETEVVAIFFEPVPEGGSVRLRITETYTDPGRYLVNGDELVWDRSFGRARNTVVLPENWFLTANAVPATIGQTDDGRVRLRYINDRPGNIEVFIKAKRR